LEALVASIRTSQALKERTEAYRALLETDKDAAAEIKKSLAAFLPAAYVNGRRRRENVTGLTGLVMCDFDHVPAERLAEIREKVNADEHTVLSYVTLSGQGLRVLAAIANPFPQIEGNLLDADHYYQRMFKAVNSHYSQLTGCDFDTACKDLPRLSTAAYDPAAYFQPEAQPFQPQEVGVLNKEERKHQREEKRQQNKQMNLIRQVYQRSIQPLLEAEGETFAAGTHNRYVMRVGYLLNKYGFTRADAEAWAAKEFASYGEAAAVVGRCYARSEEHGEWSDRVAGILNKGSKLMRATRADVAHFLKERVDIRRNLILGLVEMRWKNPTHEGIASQHSQDRRAFTYDIDAMVKSIVCHIETEMGLDATKEKVYDVIESDDMPEFDPLVDYLGRLPHWDADADPDYLAQLADTVTLLDADPGADDLWHRCLKKWMVWMIVGWVRPGEVNQTILRFVGAQGTFKSTWMKSLMPPELRAYFKVKQNSSEVRTDDLIAMSRFGLILHEESDAMTPRENNTLKAMVTTSHSDERAPYGRAPRRRNNIASLCATGNSEQFLANEQGTRRELVFRVQSILSPLDHPFPYEGIYSQAYALMQSGFPYYFSPEEQAELERHNLQFETANREEEAVDLWLRKPREGEVARWMRPGMIGELLSQRSGCHAKYNENRIGMVMKKRGFECTRHTGRIGYKVVVREYQEAVDYQKQLALLPDGQEPKPAEPLDASEAPPMIQDMFNRILGEKD
jgi:predicted P-loop ATPase